MSDPTAPEMYAEVNIKDMPQPEAGDASGSAAPAGGAEEAVVEEPSVVGGIAVDEDMAAQTPSEAGAGAEAEAEPNGGAAAGDVEGGGAPVDLSQDVTEDRRKNAARDIQAVARGRAARQQVQGVRQDQAAVRIQAAQRGKAARRGMQQQPTQQQQQQQQQLADAAGAAVEAADALPAHVNPPTEVDEGTLSGYLGLHTNFMEQSDEAAHQSAARDIQAVARGRAARQQVQGVRQDQAAVRIQAAQRGKAARRGMGMVSPPSSSMVRTLLLSPAVAVCRPLDRCWCMYA
jgi:hypothetical protein